MLHGYLNDVAWQVRLKPAVSQLTSIAISVSHHCYKSIIVAVSLYECYKAHITKMGGVARKTYMCNSAGLLRPSIYMYIQNPHHRSGGGAAAPASSAEGVTSGAGWAAVSLLLDLSGLCRRGICNTRDVQPPVCPCWFCSEWRALPGVRDGSASMNLGVPVNMRRGRPPLPPPRYAKPGA